MREQEQWTPEQDAALREALGSLRHDVEAHPLPDVRFVMARGEARRRRRLTVGAAAASVAALALGYGAWHQADPDAATLRPAATATPSTASASHGDVSEPLGTAGPLPLSAEWGRALSSTAVVRLVPAPSDQPFPGPCPATAPGQRVRAQEVRAEPAEWHGAQSLYRASSARAGDRAARRALTRLKECPGTTVADARSGPGWPRTVLVRGDGGLRSWITIAHSGPDTSVLVVTGLAVKDHTARQQVGDLSSVAQRRLERSASPTGTSGPSTDPTATSPAGPTGPATGADGGPTHVAGTRPLLPGRLFVPAAAWSSEALSAGAPTRSVTTDWEGGAALSECDADTAQDGTPGAGRFGIVSVATTTDGRFVGKQRVRLTGGAQAATAERDRLVSVLRSCGDRVAGMTVTPDPDHESAFRLDFDNPHGGPVLTTWVAVTTQRPTGAVSTFAITGDVAGDRGFAELDRLVRLAGRR